MEKKGTLVIIFLKENLSNLFSIQHPRMGVFQYWESAECFVMVWIKSIHNIGYKTAFYTSLYLLLSDSIQNILITFWPENTPPVSFKGESGANLQYIEACRLLSFSRKYWLNNNKNDKLNLEKCKRSITVILHARKFDVLAR